MIVSKRAPIIDTWARTVAGKIQVSQPILALLQMFPPQEDGAAASQMSLFKANSMGVKAN